MRPAEYKCWRGMFERCLNPLSPSFARYGGRGISICERWESFEDFRVDMGPRPSMAHTLDRIDNDGNYDPANCRWATKSEQSRNTRRNVWLTFRGKTQCMSAWATELGLTPPLIKKRLDRGWTAEEALSTPSMGLANNATLTEDQVRQIRDARARGESGASVARRFGVSPAVVCSIHLLRTWKNVA